MVDLAGFAVSTASLITTLIIHARGAAVTAARVTGKVAKALANLAKKGAPILVPVLNAIATALSWSAKGRSVTDTDEDYQGCDDYSLLEVPDEDYDDRNLGEILGEVELLVDELNKYDEQDILAEIPHLTGNRKYLPNSRMEPDTKREYITPDQHGYSGNLIVDKYKELLAEKVRNDSEYTPMRQPGNGGNPRVSKKGWLIGLGNTKGNTKRWDLNRLLACF
ncbi:Hypothetical predicted protein [Paramuricea clavata]|uniref:Uncharacterized protein n=1 Tax=Paramuricea clavata TaxID=317549 RepID=A0A6S7II17_PARCT|nr:Hypothetical predicted protein [Paramuricea clavata]